MKKSFLLFLLAAPVLVARAQTDLKGSKDSPVVSRFAGSWIRFYEFNKFNRYALRISPIKTTGDGTAKTLNVEGAVTRIIYQCPKSVSAFEVYKSYETALLQNGFEKRFACETGACGAGFGKSYPYDNAGHISGYTQDQRYFAGRRIEDDQREVYVSLYTVFTQDGPVARLDVIEVNAMAEGQVNVSAARIKSELEKTGKAVINQVYFESGTAVLKSESAPALREIAKFLTENPTLKVFVVGHTDSDGGYAFNQTLSQQRAETVSQELQTKFSIRADRLAAKGVGYLCPVAPNELEAGKAKNRRVELVKQ